MNSWLPRARGRNPHQSGRLHPHLGRHPRRAQRVPGANHRGAHLQRAQARGFPPSFLCLRRRLGRHRRLRNAGLRVRAATDREAHHQTEAMILANKKRGSARVRIKEFVNRVPGGLMLAPLLVGALCKTFAPNAPAYFKGFTQGIMTGVIPILAVWFFCMGSSIKLSATGTVLRKSGTLVLTKFFAAWAIVLVASSLSPPRELERLLRGPFGPRHCLRRRYDQRRSICVADANLRHQGGSRGFRADLDQVRAA